MKVEFWATVRQRPSGSHLIIIPAERCRYIVSEKGWTEFKGREVKVEVTL